MRKAGEEGLKRFVKQKRIGQLKAKIENGPKLPLTRVFGLFPHRGRTGWQCGLSQEMVD